MKEENEIKELSAKAEENLKRNELLQKLALEQFPALDMSNIAAFDAECIEPVREEVNGKWVQKFRYIICTPTMYPGDTGTHEIIVDAKTSADIDAYLRKGFHTLEVITSGSGKDIQYRVKPV